MYFLFCLKFYHFKKFRGFHDTIHSLKGLSEIEKVLINIENSDMNSNLNEEIIDVFK